jgi:hypothetical protein
LSFCKNLVNLAKMIVSWGLSIRFFQNDKDTFYDKITVINKLTFLINENGKDAFYNNIPITNSQTNTFHNN